MTSSRPYLVRAIYQWIVDNGLTPHLLVDAGNDDVLVPTEYVEGGRIVMNIAPMAVQGLTLGNEEVTFSARFGGKPMSVQIPVRRVLAIYTRENGQGMMFTDDGDDGPSPAGPSEGGDGSRDAGKGSHLRVVK